MPENPKQNEGIESGNDAGELEKNEGIESGRDAEKPKTKGWDLIRVQCWRIRIKMKGSNSSAMLENPKQMKGSNLGAMLENLKQNEGIESGRDVRELETKQRDRIRVRLWRTRNKTK